MISDRRTISRSGLAIQVFAFFPSKWARLVIMPTCLHIMIAMMQTTDYFMSMEHHCARAIAYLDCQIEEI